ncbi:MAG: YhbY family RNA-binding protein [Thermoplasmata archaeon]|uniref:YhbY family RNA-binding protein n=1 Tax=Candidatus Sysuiplasma superficiale TaxID=2823368 RepID=A0A8J7YJS9_9ARCH|nr:YhbY family RNA-binding protein [Candidatus Sysuiplasma superficiale]MBX8643470.1 YhbY family RNA-binding protein [Candidatus Sysuiplasma superficiale]
MQREGGIAIDRRERALAHHLKATVLIGKKGVSDESRKETMAQVEKRGMVKVKFNSTSADIDAFIESLSEKAVLVMRTGRTVVLKKRR